MTVFIYCLCDPDGRPRYIGKSVDVNHRLLCHLAPSQLEASTYKNNWIKSLLVKNIKPVVEILDEVPENDWEFWECYYIALYKSWGFKLTNGTIGGDGAHCGVLNPMYGKKGKDNPNYGSKRSEAVRKLMSINSTGEKNGFYGRTHSVEYKQILSEKTGELATQYGAVRSPEYLKLQSTVQSKVPIKVLDTLTGEEFEFNNSKDAATFLQVPHSSVRTAKNKYKVRRRYLITDNA